MTPRHLAMAAALLVAAGLALFGDKTADTEVAEPVVRSKPAAPFAAVSVATDKSEKKAAEPNIVALKPRAELIPDSADQLGEGDSAFGTGNWTPPPPPPPPPAPPPPPSAPPFPYTYMGKALSEGSWEVFMARGDKTYIVKAPSALDGMYRVDAIAPPMMTITYLPLNQVQQINIGVAE